MPKTKNTPKSTAKKVPLNDPERMKKSETLFSLLHQYGGFYAKVGTGLKNAVNTFVEAYSNKTATANFVETVSTSDRVVFRFNIIFNDGKKKVAIPCAARLYFGNPEKDHFCVYPQSPSPFSPDFEEIPENP
ncbi:MAG: hypothetical protein IJ909_08175 [Fibrobacter sp.]|nr:hypothetical protein [Fibrobacter sp.]